MTVPASSFSIESLTLPPEDPAEHRRLYNQWLTAYPTYDPIEQGYIDQAVTALIEKRRIERIRVSARTARIRTAVQRFDCEEEDYVARCFPIFHTNCTEAMRRVLRTACGCRWAIDQWQIVRHMLLTYETLHGVHRIAMIQLCGQSAHIDQLCLSETAYRMWVDCLVANPDAKQKDINAILDPMRVPMALRERDEVLWPGNPAESRARLQAIVDEELARVVALEATLRVEYEEPARAQAQELDLAALTKEEMPLLRAERMYEQSYQQAVTGLMKVRKQTAASRRPVARVEAEAPLADAPASHRRPVVAAPEAAPPAGGSAVVGRSEHRSVLVGQNRNPKIEIPMWAACGVVSESNP